MMFTLSSGATESFNQISYGMIVLGVVGLVLLIAMGWLVRFAFRQGKVLATFAFGLIASAVLIGWVLPSEVKGQTATVVQEVMLKPYYVAKACPELPPAEWPTAAVQVIGWAVVNALLFGLAAFVLMHEKKAFFMASVIGVCLAGGLFVLGLLS